eukprot:CAMPEP_0115851808 /NCGR_PEP_ID=MMETSP0287-20121206/12672_1 /TAXON_ID=412157 /ORGANISM="Chrysochromulina rotalis, Strain UIO044" /LENGTH=36 /DNA_ID= /DNA_START= /DNA_END= /DNA_ORIENTATION=
MVDCCSRKTKSDIRTKENTIQIFDYNEKNARATKVF